MPYVAHTVLPFTPVSVDVSLLTRTTHAPAREPRSSLLLVLERHDDRLETLDAVHAPLLGTNQ